MKDDVFVRIIDDPPAPRPTGPTPYGYESGTRWGYKFWEEYERRAQAREARNATLRVLQELASRVPHSPHFITLMDPSLPVGLSAWPIDLMR